MEKSSRKLGVRERGVDDDVFDGNLHPYSSQTLASPASLLTFCKARESARW
jgi:hypothetical protein